MKTFKIKVWTDGVSSDLEVEQWATFAAYVKGAQFRFVVTYRSDTCEVRLTERNSTSSVCVLPRTAGRAQDREAWVKAGRDAIEALCSKHGEQRVYDVLRQNRFAVPTR